MKYFRQSIDTLIDTRCLHAVLLPKKYQSSEIHRHRPVVAGSVLSIFFDISFDGFLCTKHCSSVRLLLAENFTLTPATLDPCRQKYSSHQVRNRGPKAVRGPLSNWYGAYRIFGFRAFFLISDSDICGISAVVVVCSCFSRRVGWCSSFWCNL